MKKIRVFKCSNDHIIERLVKDNVTVIECSECKKEAKRVLSAPRCFGNTTGKSPASRY